LLVSNFVLFKDPEGTMYSDDTRYSLQITNLEDKPVEYLVECYFSHSDRTLVQNSVVASTSGTYRRKGDVIRGSYQLPIPAKESKYFTLRLQPESKAELELLGFLELSLPPLRSSRSLRLVAQFPHPVKVLLHPRREDRRRNRVTGIVDPQGVIPYHTSQAEDYSSEAIAISTGQAENEIQPTGLPIYENLVAQFRESWRSGALEPGSIQGASMLPEEERAAALLDLLLGLSHTDSEMGALNELLAEEGSEVRLRRAD
jgi:hypothetical protein